ncbi:MAG: molybdopterin-dependent oxidoreductase alpha subunit, partial [Flavobacteriales bacterium]
MNTRAVNILPPEKLTGLKTHTPSKKAAGLKGVTIALRHLSDELGLLEGLKLMTKINQPDGADCPGCAWPDPKDRSSFFEYCENGAKAVAEEATNKRVDRSFFAEHSVEDLSRLSDYEIGKSGRITEPFFLAKGSSHYAPISWKEANEKIAKKLKAITPDEAVFYTSGRTGNETAFLYQLMVRQYGTNNMPDCSNMCHESSGSGLTKTVGIGKGSVTLEDLYEAEVIIVIGQNPGTNHPRMLSALQKCKSNGGKIVHVNPLPEVGTDKFINPQSPVQILMGGTKISDHFLQVRINGDVALLKLLMRGLLEAEDANPGNVLDHEFIETFALGFEDFKQDLLATDFAQAEKDSGLSYSELLPVIDLLAQNKKIIICWAMGITQHKNGVANVQEIVNLLLMKGAIGKPGAGTCPVRGHSNVQGDRTMGIYEKPSSVFLDALEKHFKIAPPRAHGYDTVEAIEAMAEKKVKFFMAMGGNFVSATPDSEFTGKAMMTCDLTVQISTKLNRGHLITGEEALILPCISRTEKDVQNGVQQFQTVENSMGVVHSSTGNRTPASPELRSEVEIVTQIASSLFASSPIDWSELHLNNDVVRDHIEACIPGFNNFNERVRIPQGFSLPNGARTRKFNTESGKAEFTVNKLPEIDPKEAEFIMMTIRTHDQYNTTIYGLDDRYRGIENERRVVLMNPEDMASKGFQKGQLVDLESVFNGVKRRTNKFHVLPYSIPRKCIATYFPETNALVP